MRHDNQPSAQIIPAVAASHRGTTFLAFSGGKDCCAAWLALRPHFSRIIPVFYYSVPFGFSFQLDWLAHCERFFSTPIIRMPHPSLYRQLYHGVFQPPEHLQPLRTIDLPQFTYEDLYRELRSDLDLPTDTPIAVGNRAADSITRRTDMITHGVIDRRGHAWFPIWDWTLDTTMQIINAAGLGISPEYDIWGRTYDGLSYQYIAPLKQHYPNDYARLLEWFPLAELELFRHDEFDLQSPQSQNRIRSIKKRAIHPAQTTR